jgi:hypothetical protein
MGAGAYVYAYDEMRRGINMNNKALFVCVLAGSCATVACDDMDIDFGGGPKVETPFHYSYDVKPGGRLELETFNGSVEIRSWDQNKVDVSGTKSAGTAALNALIKIDSHATADGVEVRAIHPNEHHGNMGVRFVVRVPHSFELDRITSSNGQVKVEDLDGAVRVHTSNGGIHLSQIKGNVDATTSNGAIELNELNGRAVLSTSNSHIQGDHLSGPVDATTSNGSINIAFATPPKSDIHAETNNSSIEISMPESSAVRVRASTSNSSITSDFDVDKSGTVSKDHLEGTIHGGGPMLDLHTSNGSIRLAKP